MILYKKDSKGKIRFLEIISEGPDLIQRSGLTGTGKAITHKKTCKAKNIGKSNYVDPTHQAVKEVQAKVEEKLKEGYFKSIEEARTIEVILPMLANDYKKRKHKIDWSSAFVQPKFDGMRCLAMIDKNGNVTLISRDGTDIMTAHGCSMKHIVEGLSKLAYKFASDFIILDGELYCHGESFQDNMKLIKKYRPGESERIKFHVYDIVSDDCYADRFRTIDAILDKEDIPFELVHNVPVISEEEVPHWHSYFLEEGYEGSMIRHGIDGYQPDKRTDNLLKNKDFIDITAKIVDVTPNDANPKHGTPWLISPDVPKKFKAGVKMDHKWRETLLKDKDAYIGQTAEIRFFEYTDDGQPRFPVLVGIRLDKKK